MFFIGEIMNIGILNESDSIEKRVAIVPETVKTLTKNGHNFFFESGCGENAGFPDEEYLDSGGKILEDNIKKIELLILLKCPQQEVIKKIKDKTTIISQLNASNNSDAINELKKINSTLFAMELVPRIARAQKMDILSSQASIAGYKAAIMAANHLGKYFPMMMTAAGTIPPSKILVIGAGVAGLQAIATSKRLGANVEAFDVRDAAAEQVESLGAKFLKQENSSDAEDEGGYAREQTENEKAAQKEFIKSNLNNVDALITTAAIPGKKAPIIITKDMVESMKAGSVIIDLAAESGGNVELTKPGEITNHNNVSIHGPINVPSSMAFHASQLYSRNVMGLIELIIDENRQFNLDFDDEIIKATCVNFYNKESK
tara:strand:- start:1230 stop:2348 length:1119 start_codon:yes stop_codon:yes gene_type:complete